MITQYPRPRLLSEVCHTRHGVIEASAGTGKTYTIEHLVVDLLLRTDAQLEEILVVTFTEKATTELRRRIRTLIERVLEEGVSIDSEASVSELEDQDPDHWFLDSPRRRKLESELFAFDRAPIFTIHGFCNRVLRELAFSSGQMLNPKNVDTDKAFTDAWREALRTRFAIDETFSKPLRAWIAGGRTEDELRRLLQSAHRQGYLANRLDLAREVEKHAGFLLASFEPREYVADLARLAVQSTAIGHAEDAASDLLRHLKQSATPDALLNTLKTDDIDCLVSPKERRTTEPGLRFPDGLSEGHSRCRYALQRLGRLCLLQRAEERAYAEQFLPVVESVLLEQKERRGLFEYDDLLSRVYEALQGENGPEMTRMLQSRFRFGLIDEFQDTDARQWAIFRMIFVESEAGVLFVIGDPKQAIYGFRGADVQTYIEARETLLLKEDSPAQYLSLADNYRSTASMISAVNLILETEGERALLQGDIRYDSPVRCGRPEMSLQTNKGEPVRPITLWTHRPKQRGRRRDLSGWALMDTFMTALTDTLTDIIKDAHTYSIRESDDDTARPLTAKDVFVLVRSRREAQLVADGLNAVGIPCVRQQESDPLRSEEAQGILDVLTAVATPTSESACMWAFATPFFDIGWTELAQFRDLDPETPAMRRFKMWRDLADAGSYGRLFRSLRRDSGLIARSRFRIGGDEQLTRFDQLFEWLLEVIGSRRITLDWLVSFLSRAVAGDITEDIPEIGPFRLADARDAVQVITMHKSKGLQAPIVCLFGGFLKPWASPVNVVNSDGQRHVVVGQAARDAFQDELDRETADEDERLLYVALTRAEAKLYLPFIDSDLNIGGPYGRLNQRLRAMAQLGLPDELFFREDVDGRRGSPRPTPADTTPRTQMTVARDTLKCLTTRDDRSDFEEMRWRHAPWIVTSYSAMKGLEKTDEDEAVAHVRPVIDQIVAPPSPARADVLPGGRFMGRFLHEAIEALNFADVLDLELPAWQLYPPVIEAFERTMRRHDIDPRWIRPAQTLIYHALARRLPLSESQVLPPLASVRGHREIEFVFPMPEATHPLLNRSKQTGDRSTIDRGLIKGFIDFTFEYEEQIYWLDWKSDVMTDYSPAALIEHVDRHYDLQAWLYTLSVVRLLDIMDAETYERRFGGFLYVFLRGLTEDAPPEHGVVFSRPSWDEIAAFEESLVTDPRLPKGRSL